MSSKELRDKIRAATVGAKKRYASEIVKYSGVDIEVRQASIRDKAEYLQKSVDPKTNQTDFSRLLGYAVIASCYVPGTNDKVFDETDYEAIVSGYSGEFGEKVWEAVQRLNELTPDEAKKN